MSYIKGSLIKAKYQNGKRVICSYMNGVKVWSAGSSVTYNVDSSTKYTEEVNYGDSCLSPTSFTPSKSGYSFVGWKKDTTANTSVLNSLTMESNPITLYAVFKKTVSVSYTINGTGSIDPTSSTIYYNNGTYNYPIVNLATSSTISKQGYTFTGWSIDSQTYNAGVSITLKESKTATAQWKSNAYTVDLAATLGTSDSRRFDMNTEGSWSFGSWSGESNSYYSHATNEALLHVKSWNEDYPYIKQAVKKGEGQYEYAKNTISTTFDAKGCPYLIITYDSNSGVLIRINGKEAATTQSYDYGQTVINLIDLGITSGTITFSSEISTGDDYNTAYIKYKSFRFDTTNS